MTHNPETQIADRGVLAAKARVPDHVVFRSFAAETVVLNLETGQYHGLNPTGGRMLELLGRAASVAAAAVALAGEYEEPVGRVEADLCAFCTELAGRGLIELRAAAA
jgi:hypothetical protein